MIELSRPTRAPWDTPLQDVLEAVLAKASDREDSPVGDAFFGRPQEIWALRHALSEGVKSAGPLIAFDLGFTRDKVIAFRAAMTGLLGQSFPTVEICDFGHLGDGGLHFNLVKRDGPLDAEFERSLRDCVMDQAVRAFGGSISAERGIGPKNDRYFRIFGQRSGIGAQIA
ncbi:FAD-linked oxidase C-terminal domain-containing protein [Tropicibacter sp. S64]|uniref:FAD-linked oxidase C-terminal domain-containing protein n=1 Tax=Tropicibacter sp. S64 TaxID=3415122 RepID=UPI003C7B0F7A